MHSRTDIRRVCIFAAIMFGLWMLLSGHYSALLIAIGLGSSVFVAVLALRMGLLERLSLGFHLRTLTYLPWLLKEIFKTNIDVARRILSPRLPIAPRMVRVRASQKTELGVTLYANSITLTPGTLSVDVRGGHIEVHALAPEIADDLLAGEMDRRVSALERR